MSIAQNAILAGGTLLLSLLLAGLFVRRRARVCVSFTVYVATVAVSSSLILFWPERFFAWSFYLAKEATLNLVTLAVALELTLRVFQAFPAAIRTARRAFLLVLGVTVIAVVTAPSRPPTAGREAWAAELVLALQPRITNGTAWLFGAIFALILYYRIPLHQLHKAIAAGFMAYLLLFTFVLDLISRADPALYRAMSYANSIAYTLLEVYWVWAAWRRDDPPPVDPAVVDRLQPWR
jgi:hypothetical protein